MTFGLFPTQSFCAASEDVDYSFIILLWHAFLKLKIFSPIPCICMKN